MNKKIAVIVIVLLVLLLGGYFFMNKKNGNSLVSKVQEAANNTPTSLKGLMALGTAQSCTFSSSQDGYTSEGTIYVSGNKMRGDFSSTMSGKTTKSHMITSDNTSYVWTDGEKNGFKMTYTPEETEAKAGTSTPVNYQSGAFDLNADMNYQCSAWLVDSSKFTPPSDVNFASFEDMQKSYGVPSY